MQNSSARALRVAAGTASGCVSSHRPRGTGREPPVVAELVYLHVVRAWPKSNQPLAADPEYVSSALVSPPKPACEHGVAFNTPALRHMRMFNPPKKTAIYILSRCSGRHLGAGGKASVSPSL